MILDGMPGRVEKNYPLNLLSTWRIGGPAEAVYWPETVEDLSSVWKNAQEAEIPVRLIGRGSNVLFPDEGLPGITLVTTSLRGISWGDYTVRVEAGYTLARLAQEAGERGWSGLEFARGIPGSVGGAIMMNAGAHGGEMASRILGISTLWADGSIRKLERSQFEFAYRHCSLRGKAWVLEAQLMFSPGNREQILHHMKENLTKRTANQPLEEPNAGSVFRNPPGDSAGRLIEAAGWKGKTIGGAKVSEKHANFIVNTGRAKSKDVLALIEAIVLDVQIKYGITLQTEVESILTGNRGA
ncbi:UDP-N-acetylmuramate dehydrogenase [Desulfosporosinus sp.]|uniref:UDP-N-acetylmuramate dehydrogenase n=1 Tax=Desulfosporosinus sp. TaxID=157907 RepID=UPI0025C636FD|nr:UDP-N-acetylmuramate dehydrogenase [Desulfosporosinus sp.]MBC2721381.1 UDP-N-acetylmuramate dehydrogenase [Desulfosporosinus sp.]MBC2728100.1 UDP-N-acetylmuramate dehydrogenase [Desulfosporosinus sp.]